MLTSIFTIAAFSLGYFIESIVGFGGTVIAGAILGFFIDIKQLILIALYFGTVCSFYILVSTYKKLNLKVFLKHFPICLAGNLIGVTIFIEFNSQFLLKLFGILLIILALQMTFLGNIQYPKYLKNSLLLIGGVVQGIFGMGGPFMVSALKSEFANKSQLRTTMACFFLTFNIIRIIHLAILEQLKFDFGGIFWWAFIPIIIAIYFGHKVHLAISETAFRKSLSLLILASGIAFLLK